MPIWPKPSSGPKNPMSTDGESSKKSPLDPLNIALPPLMLNSPQWWCSSSLSFGGGGGGGGGVTTTVVGCGCAGTTGTTTPPGVDGTTTYAPVDVWTGGV